MSKPTPPLSGVYVPAVVFLDGKEEPDEAGITQHVPRLAQCQGPSGYAFGREEGGEREAGRADCIAKDYSLSPLTSAPPAACYDSCRRPSHLQDIMVLVTAGSELVRNYWEQRVVNGTGICTVRRQILSA